MSSSSSQAEARQEEGDVKVRHRPAEHVAVKAVQQTAMPRDEVARVLQHKA